MAAAAAAATTTASPWPDLPPDVLRDVSGRLHDAADFVRFHAVCKPWRDTVAPPSSHPPFLPCLLAPPASDSESDLMTIRSVSHRTSSFLRVPASAAAVGKTVLATDGPSSGRVLAVGIDGACSLVNPLTGTVTSLPSCLPAYTGDLASARGVVTGDGTVLIYNVTGFGIRNHIVLRVAILRPGDAAWTAVSKILYPFTLSRWWPCHATYHGGKIVLAAMDHVGIGMFTVAVASVNDEPFFETPYRAGLPTARRDAPLYNYNYLVESRGELLWFYVDVAAPPECRRGAELVGRVSVSVYAMEGTEWVRRDGRSLADRVLFLGWPTSFAVDAARFAGGGGGGGGGGCAYFVVHMLLKSRCLEAATLYRYSFVDGTSTVADELPEGWHEESGKWFVPRPAIAPARV